MRTTISKTTRETSLAIGVAAASALVAALLPAAQAQAQPRALEEVVVTSQKRATGLDVQEVPTAISVYSGEAIEQTFAVDLTDIGRMAPNVQLNSAGTFPGFANFFIRGIGVSNTTRSQDPAVGAFFDGIYVGFGPSSIASAFDFQSVEVLRGPQGTLFGKNVTGGAVSVTSRRPGTEFGGYAKFQLGNYDTMQLSGAVDLPVSDNLSMRVAGMSRSADGYFNNLFNGQSKPEDDVNIIRPSLLWTPTERTSVAVIGEYYRGRGGSSAAQNLDSRIDPRVAGPATVQRVFGYTPPSDKYDILHNNQGYIDSETKMLVVDASYEADHGIFTVITGGREVRYDSSTDFDGSPFTVFSFPDNEESQEQFSIEARYASSFSDVIEFTAGAFYFTQEYDIGERREFFIGGTPAQPTIFQQVGLALTDDTSYALFGEANWNLNDRWSLLFGGRVTHEEKEVVFCPFSGNATVFASLSMADCPNTVTDDETWTSFSPKVGVNWRITDDVFGYATWSTGFRSGSYNIRASIPETLGPVDEEEVVTWEAGIKSTLMDDRLRFNVALFHSSYDDIQRTISDTVVVNGVPQVAQVLRNAAEATITGIEVESSVMLTDTLSADFSLGYLDAKYDRFPGIDADRNGVYERAIDDPAAERLEFERVPEFEFTAGLQHRMPLGDNAELFSRVSYQWRDEHFVDTLNSPSIAVDSYGLLDASITYDRFGDGWSVAIFGRNLTDEDFHDFGFDGGTHRAVWGGVPRTYGIELTTRF
ncbi:MAG: TonB-dependent receptor [Haliea sp.]|uniref:TonB-dependent receptor n=1 Tax=Haliea sp. TaxID=1932666 RepID=UPI0032F073AC